MTTKRGLVAETRWDLEAERELWADICQKSFWQFCDYAMGYGDHPDYHWWTIRVHRPFCDWFEKNALEWHAGRQEGQGEPYDLMVVVHREFGKTMIIAKAGTLWLHVLNPNLSSYLGSATVPRAQGFFDPMKRIFPFSKIPSPDDECPTSNLPA
jgi:hypothetical protein